MTHDTTDRTPRFPGNLHTPAGSCRGSVMRWRWRTLVVVTLLALVRVGGCVRCVMRHAQLEDSGGPTPLGAGRRVSPDPTPGLSQGVQRSFRDLHGGILAAIPPHQLAGRDPAPACLDELDRLAGIAFLQRLGEGPIHPACLVGEPVGQGDAGLHADQLDGVAIARSVQRIASVVQWGVADDVVEERKAGGVGFQLREGGGQFPLDGRLLVGPLVVEGNPGRLRLGVSLTAKGAFSPSSSRSKSSAANLSRSVSWLLTTSGSTSSSLQRLAFRGGIAYKRRAGRPASMYSLVRARHRAPGWMPPVTDTAAFSMNSVGRSEVLRSTMTVPAWCICNQLGKSVLPCCL